eukprot:m.44846 g.44846  ORF g.44846 m.44846 type:complete len:506 (+) comp10636_c0_seq1:132-1649(+)
MQKIVGIFIASLLFSTVAAFDTDEGVIVATDATFDEIVAANENALVEFYAPWCGHCKALAPEYVSAAKTLEEDSVNAVLVKVDCTVEEKLASRFGVQGYPTLKFFRNGEPTDYSGGRTAADIVFFLKKKSGPPATTLADVAGAEAFASDNDLVYIGLFEDTDGAEATEFKAVAADSDLNFGISSNADIAAKYGVEMPAIVCLRSFDEPQINFDGEFSALNIVTFVNGNSLPLVIEFSNENAPKIFGGDMKTHMLFHSTKAEFKDYKDIFTSFAKANKGKLLCIFVDIDAEDNQRILEFFEVTPDNSPAVRLINLEEHMKKYSLTQEVTMDSLTKFAESYFDGSLRPFLKSEPVPEGWDSEPVKILTGENFDEVAVKSDKIVFVEFYAPWCGHCKQLVPIWDALGEAFESTDNVVIAKLDATTNELEEHPVEGFPTLKIFSAEGTATEYEGGRDIKELVEFVNEYAGTDVAVPAVVGHEDGPTEYDDYGYDYDYDEEPEGNAHDEL